jgi:hypothetical protein
MRTRRKNGGFTRSSSATSPFASVAVAMVIPPAKDLSL